ncbi:hypothetical protein ACFYU5_19175 [Nocardia aobensis]|uniref:Head-tail adaptor protein n=1 Tax=Nocardia aobensis TaxID=257277 RepID=A0ABW6P5W6_9NOCA
MKKLGNDTLTLLVNTKTSSDELGVAVNSTARVDVSGCSVQPATDSESDSNTDITVAKWRAHCPPTTEMLAVKTADEVEYLGIVYQVYADREGWTDRKGVPHHVTLILRKARG